MKKVIETIEKIQIAFGTIFLAIFLLTVVFQVASRYAGFSATWTQDVANYSFIVSVFMGAAAMVHEKKHFAFTSISDMMKDGPAKKILNLIILLLMLAFSIIMVYYGILIAKQFWNYTWENIPQLKKGPVWLCIPVSGGLMILYIIEQIVDDVKCIVNSDYEKKGLR